MNKKIILFVFWGLIIFVVVGMICIVLLLSSQGSKCLKNPFVFGANQVKGDVQVQCGCQVVGNQGGFSNFCFNTKELKQGSDCQLMTIQVERNISVGAVSG